MTWILGVFLSHTALTHGSPALNSVWPPTRWNVTIGFQKMECATQILVKVSRLTVNSSAPKPHFPLHRFSESGVRGWVQGGGGENDTHRKRGEETSAEEGRRGEIESNCGRVLPCRDSVGNMRPSSDTWRPQGQLLLARRWNERRPRKWKKKKQCVFTRLKSATTDHKISKYILFIFVFNSNYILLLVRFYRWWQLQVSGTRIRKKYSEFFLFYKTAILTRVFNWILFDLV